MNLNFLATFLAMAPAPTPPGTQPNPTGSVVQMLGMFAIMGLMFYFVLIRPQQKKAKEHANLLAKLKAGDKVITSAGVVGIVTSVKDKTVTIRSADSKMELLKSAVTEITEIATES
jgi:preprotein translocase subunit YajC